MQFKIHVIGPDGIKEIRKDEVPELPETKAEAPAPYLKGLRKGSRERARRRLQAIFDSVPAQYHEAIITGLMSRLDQSEQYDLVAAYTSLPFDQYKHFRLGYGIVAELRHDPRSALPDWIAEYAHEQVCACLRYMAVQIAPETVEATNRIFDKLRGS